MFVFQLPFSLFHCWLGSHWVPPETWTLATNIYKIPQENFDSLQKKRKKSSKRKINKQTNKQTNKINNKKPFLPPQKTFLPQTNIQHLTTYRHLQGFSTLCHHRNLGPCLGFLMLLRVGLETLETVETVELTCLEVETVETVETGGLAWVENSEFFPPEIFSHQKKKTKKGSERIILEVAVFMAFFRGKRAVV